MDRVKRKWLHKRLHLEDSLILQLLIFELVSNNADYDCCMDSNASSKIEVNAGR
jgi:hypothetical protein